MKTVRTAVVTILLIASSVLLAHAGPPLQEPLPEGETPVSIVSTLTEPTPFFGGEGIPIRLAGGQFDPLSGTGPPNLAAGMTLDSYPGDGTGYYLVQFNGPITEADKAALAGAGAEVFDYIPDFTLVVKMNDAIRVALASTRSVRWIGLYQPAYRVAPSLLQTYTATGRSETLELIVVVFKGENVAQIAGQLEALGGTVLETVETEWKGKIKVQIDTAQIEAIARISGVKWVEQAPEWQLFNNVAADIMDVRDVWDNHSLHGAGQTIAVCDTGLDKGSSASANLHDDFEDGSGNSRVIQIFDWVGDGASDVNSGHGTHVAGSVLGNGARSGATPSTHTYPSSAYVGMAPEANLVFQAVGNNLDQLTGIPFDLNTLFAQADTAGADFHTNSWGSSAQGEYTSDSEDVDEYIWNHKDFTILFAAGNEGADGNWDGVIDLDSVDSPGTAKNCITVGASENNRSSGGYNPGGACSTWGGISGCWPLDYPANPIRDDRLSDDPNGLAAFSSRGPTNDSRVKPDIVAPGTNIASTKSSMATGSGWGAINTYYMYMGGTSMATPLAAGAAALVRDFYQGNEGITSSAALIKATLINGATDMSPGQYGTGSTQEIPDPPRPNNVEGWGRVNVENSIFPPAPLTLSYDDEASGLSTSSAATYVYTVTTAGQPMRTTLAWSDYPGSPVADGGLVNDLDLSITSPGGTTLYPSNGSTYDRANNVVGIDITSAGTGVYTITVGGYNVPHGPQPYALVVSGAGELGQSGGGSAEMLIYYFPLILKGYPPPPLPSLANGDFEAGPDGSWTEYSMHGWDLILHADDLNVTPHSGSWAVWLGGEYNETAYISQDVNVSSGSPYLSYYHWIASEDICGYDYGYVRINGSNVGTYKLCDDNDTDGWDYETVNLSSYAGQTVELQFRVTTDGVWNSNWFLDDVAFQASPSAIEDVSRPPITTSSPSDPSDPRSRQ
jgi:hypothetical protein